MDAMQSMPQMQEEEGKEGEEGGSLPVRNVVACSNCRSQKIKCFPAETQDKPCRRCEKYELPCAYLQHRRGRKKKLKPEDTDSLNGSPASARHDQPHMSYPAIVPKDFAHQPQQFHEETFRSSIPRQDYLRPSYRDSGPGIPTPYAYASFPDNRYPLPNPQQSFPRLNPLHGLPGYTHQPLAHRISADRETLHDAAGGDPARAYSTPFALPGLSGAVAEGQMPAHMQHIAGAGQGLLQIPNASSGTAGYGGRAVPSVSLLNDLPAPTTTTASGMGSGIKLSPRDPPAASPANSSGPASVPRAGEGSTTSNHTRGATPPIRPIEISRFPFLSPAIGTEGSRGGLTPASLPNILNTTAPATGENSISSSSAARSGAGGESAGKPQKFASLHRMVADVRDDESDYASSTEDGARPGTAEEQRQGKRKRRKVDPGRGVSEDVDRETALGKDPVSCGFVTEGQARELFGIFMAELNSSLPMLDTAVHSFDYIRAQSPFLLSTTLCVASRFLRGGPDTTPELTTSIPPERARAVHESCLRLARSQMHLAFQHALMSLEIVQAMTLLAIWKEPDDDKAGFYFNRAVVMAKELHLGRMDRSRPRSEEDLLWRRIRERVWLCLFIVNTIFAMQFNQILQITHEDSLIANSFDWHVGSHSPMDLPLIASVQLRARFLHYKSLLEITAADADDLERTDKSHTATLLSLSILTRTSNQDLGNINAHWVEQIRQASPTGSIPIKPFIWLAGLRLHLNIVIMNQTIRIENARQLQRNSLGSIAAFHHSINAACEVLTRMKMLPKRQLAFASDTLLHFTIYAGYFLFTVCTKSTRDLLEPQERQHCEDIVIEASEKMASASLYPADAPALHARFLRRLTSPYLPPQDPAHEQDNGHPQGLDTRSGSANHQPPHPHQHFDYNSIIPPSFHNPALANGFQMPQDSGAPGNIALAETIWGGTDDGLWMQFDGAWWDHVMQDMTANNANRPAGINQHFQQ